MMMSRFFSSRPAPSDAGAISALLARGELAELDADRDRLKAVIARIAPRRSTILEGELKRLTRRRVEIEAVLARATR